MIYLCKIQRGKQKTEECHQQPTPEPGRNAKALFQAVRGELFVSLVHAVFKAEKERAHFQEEEEFNGPIYTQAAVSQERASACRFDVEWFMRSSGQARQPIWVQGLKAI